MTKRIKKILLTGSSGTIGTALFEELLKQKYEVIGFDRKPNIWEKRLDLLTIKGDLLKKEDISKIPPNIYLIVHLAANTRVYNLVIKPVLALENIITTYNILEFSRKNKVKNLIFSSSREIYGNIEKMLMTKENEASFLNTESPYAASKISNEAMIYAYYKCYGINYLVFRFSNVYGKYAVGDRFVPLLIKKMRKDKPVQIYGKDKTLDFTYIDDCIAGIVLGVKKFFKVKNNTLNLSSGRAYKLVEVAKLIKELMGSQSKIVLKPNRPGEVIRYKGSIQKAKQLLGYKAKFSLTEGFKKTIKWYKNKELCKRYSSLE